MTEGALRYMESVGQLGADFTDGVSQTVSPSLIKVLKMKSTAQAEEFHCASRKPLHKGLHTLNTEYVNTVRLLGRRPNHVLRTALQILGGLQTEFRDSIIGDRFPHLPLVPS